MYKWRMQILSNDAKRMYKKVSEDFIPYPGMAIRGYMGDTDDETKVNAVVWDKNADEFRVALSWMGVDVPDSVTLVQSGWNKIAMPAV